jgi:Asp-tRNA(Asn)/Glu-tRNA(Gln) amidotransferase A subunit family amidase
MPRELISTEVDEQKVSRAVVSAANQLEKADATIAALDFEVNRCYEILAIFEPIAGAYAEQARRLDLDEEQRESLNIVLDAIDALASDVTPEQARLIREEAEEE